MAKRKASELQAPATESFEESLNELQSIVSELEDGSLGLEASLARFESGVGLLRKCHVILESAEQKIETLTRFNDTVQPSVAPWESAETLHPNDHGVDTVDAASSIPEAAAMPDPDSSQSSLF